MQDRAELSLQVATRPSAGLLTESGKGRLFAGCHAQYHGERVAAIAG